jgi:integrase
MNNRNVENKPKMRDGIIKRGTNSYSIALPLGKQAETGKYKYQWVTVQGTKKEAKERRIQSLHEIKIGDFIKPTNLLVAEYLENWLQNYKPNLSPRGFERYRDIIRKHFIPAFNNIKLVQLKPEHLQKHYANLNSRGLSIGTIRYHHAVIHVALKTAVKQGVISRNVADAVDVPRMRRQEMQTWNEDEINRFLEKAKGSPYYALFYTALFTGMRRSELLGLKWEDVDLILGQIHVNRGLHHLKNGSYIFTEPKSMKSRRTIALSPSAILVLRDHMTKRKLELSFLDITQKDTDLVFATIDGKPLRPNTITRAWETTAKHAGLKVIRLHDARHTHASLMLKQGIHPKIVQERLGHSSIQMTLDIYSHVAPGLQEAAAKRFEDLIKANSVEISDE